MTRETATSLREMSGLLTIGTRVLGLFVAGPAVCIAATLAVGLLIEAPVWILTRPKAPVCPTCDGTGTPKEPHG